MKNCIKWFGVGALLLVVIGGGLVWQGQNRLADKLLASYLPALQYSQISLDSMQGRLVLRGVKMQLPGVVVDGGVVEVTVNPATLLRGPIQLEKVTLRGLKATIDPAKLSFSASSSGAVGLPARIVVQDAAVTVVQGGLPHLLPLHGGGEASYHAKEWSFQLKVRVADGVVRTSGTVVEDKMQGDLLVDGVTIPALLQQLGVERRGLDPQGRVDGSVKWELPLSSPNALQLQGDVALHGVMVMAQRQQQRIGDIAVKLAWQGKQALLQLHKVEVRTPHLRWLQQLSGSEGESFLPSAFSDFHWQLDHLLVKGGKVDVDVVTPAGKANLLLRIGTVDLHDVTWKRMWPKQVNVQGTFAKGKLDWSLQGHEIDLKMHGVSLATLEPLLISVSGLRIPKGDLNLRLRGEVSPKLKLFGELTMHQLALAPRIPVAGVDLSIPYRLGLRALTNANGVTHIPLAIRGTLKKPDVDVAQIIAEVKKNLFNGTLDGGFKHLSIDFLTNQQKLTPTGEKQLEKLERLLRNNSKLQVTMRGCVGSLSDLSPLRAQRLAAARVQVVRNLLKHRLQRSVLVDTIYPMLTQPSPDIDGKDDRVEISLYPL